MDLISSPSGRSAAIASSTVAGTPGVAASRLFAGGPLGSDPRLEAVAQELAQAVSRGDLSREQADAFLGRLARAHARAGGERDAADGSGKSSAVGFGHRPVLR